MSEPSNPAGIESTKEVDWSEFRSLWGDASLGRDLTRLRSLSILVAVACWAIALILIGVTWSQVAELSNVADQVPWIVSGAITSIILAIVGAGVLVGGILASMVPKANAKN